MEDNEILQVWKNYDRKLEENLLLSRQNATAITALKVQSFLASMKPLKIFTIVAGVLWVGLLDVLIVSLFHIASPFFLVSAILLTILNKLAIGIYLYQLILLHQADITEPVLATQEKIARLKSSTLWVARLLFLQLPLWTTFYWNKSMLENGSMSLFITQALVTGVFIFIAVWLFINISYRNRNKKWFGLIFNGKEWSPLMKSMEVLSQLEEYKK